MAGAIVPLVLLAFAAWFVIEYSWSNRKYRGRKG